MEIRIEDCPDAFCVILRGPKESEELQRTLRLLQGHFLPQRLFGRKWWMAAGLSTRRTKFIGALWDWENLRAAGNLMDCFDVQSRR